MGKTVTRSLQHTVAEGGLLRFSCQKGKKSDQGINPLSSRGILAKSLIMESHQHVEVAEVIRSIIICPVNFLR